MNLSGDAVYALAGAVLLLVFFGCALAMTALLGVPLTTRTFAGFAFGYLVNLGVYALALYLYLAIERREAEAAGRG